MILKKINNVVCDMQGCSCKTTKQILFSENSKIGLNLCDKCLMSLYDLMAETIHLKGGKNGKK